MATLTLNDMWQQALGGNPSTSINDKLLQSLTSFGNNGSGGSSTQNYDDASSKTGARLRILQGTNATAISHIFGVGDSIQFGSIASTRPLSFWEIARKELHRLLGFTVTDLADGHIRTGSAAFGNPKWTISAGAPTDEANGFGNMARRFPAGAAMQFAGTFRRCLINYRKEVGSTATITINDSINGNILVAGAMSAASNANNAIFDSGDLGANAARTLTVTVNTAPGTVISGYFIGNNFNKEICFWNGGFAGWKMSDFQLDPLTFDLPTAFIGARGNAMICTMGMNDGIQATPPASVISQYSALGTTYANQTLEIFGAGFPRPSIIFMPVYARNPSPPTQVAADAWRNNLIKSIYTAAKTIPTALGNQQAAVFDWSNLMGGIAGSWSGDGIHMNDQAHSLTGTALAQYLWKT